MNQEITTDKLNLTLAANAVNSPAGYVLLLERAIWNETHRSMTSSASWSFFDLCIGIRLCVTIDRSVFAQGDNQIGANRASGGNETSGSGYQRKKSYHSQKCRGIRGAYSEQQTAHQMCKRQR